MSFLDTLAKVLESLIRDVFRVDAACVAHQRRQPDSEKSVAGAQVRHQTACVNAHRFEHLINVLPLFALGFMQNILTGRDSQCSEQKGGHNSRSEEHTSELQSL